MSDDALNSDGGVYYRDPNAERDADHYGPGTGGKKRKVPAFTQALGRQEEMSSSAEDDEEDSLVQTSRFAPIHRPPRSRAAAACAFRKALFLRRKAALITLYVDAQNAITNGSVKPGTQGLPQIMDIPTFEKLLPSLEDIGMTDWPPDRLSWRSRWDGPPSPKSQTLEQWRTGFDRRLRRKASQQPTVRGGWAPEGSFEFEVPSKASLLIRAKNKDRSVLHKLVVDLRALTLSAKFSPQIIGSPTSAEKVSQKPPRLTSGKKQDAVTVKDSPPLSRTESKESDPASMKGKSKKKKKKKRSVLANQGNPHHVDNYRPTRKTAINSDPFESYPHHESLLFPPPMRLLSTVPQRRTAPLPGSNPTMGQARVAEDDFICCFCEMDLFFGTEAARKRAIRRMKEERRRKEAIRNKAKDFAEGKGKLRDDESEYDQEDWCDEVDGHGRCACGRQISDPHRPTKSRLKPPETDPPLGGHGSYASYPAQGHQCDQRGHLDGAGSFGDSRAELDFAHDDLD